MNKQKTIKITVVGVMAALSSIMYMFLPEIPLIPSLPYVKIDLSDLPAVLTGFTIGAWPGVLVVVLKNIIHLLKSSTFTFGIGELINVCIGSAIILSSKGTFHLFMRIFKSRKSDLLPYYLSCAVAILSTIITGWLVNFAMTPLFYYLSGIPQLSVDALIAAALATTPFNAFKAAVMTVPLYPVIITLRKSLPWVVDLHTKSYEKQLTGAKQKKIL